MKKNKPISTGLRNLLNFLQLLWFLSLFLGVGTYYLLLVENYKAFLYGFLLVLALLIMVAFIFLKKVFTDKSKAHYFMVAIVINGFIAAGVTFIAFLLPLLGFDYTSWLNKIVVVIALFFGARSLSKVKPGLIV